MNYVERDTLGMYARSKDHAGPGPALMGADTLLDTDVCNTQGESLGDIKEIMLDMRTGKLAYAVLSFGGVLGMGEKLFAVPWHALTLDTQHKRFLLDIAQKRLKNAPGFNKDRWPDMAEQTWASTIHDFYKTEIPVTGA